jgi:hypothetical protein
MVTFHSYVQKPEGIVCIDTYFGFQNILWKYYSIDTQNMYLYIDTILSIERIKNGGFAETARVCRSKDP